MESSSVLDKLQLHAALVIMQLGFAGFEILSRNLLVGGFSPFVFPVYRNAIAFAVLAPLAYFVERKHRTKLERHQILMFLSTGTIGIFFNQIAYVLGLRYTSASFTSAYRNSLPVFTFLVSYILGIEKVQLTKLEHQLKILGTSLGVVGAFIMSLFRGPEVIKPPSSGNHLLGGWHSFEFNTWHFGVIILTGAYLSFAVFLTLQAQIMKNFPAPLSIASISIGIGCVQLAVLAAIVDPKLSRWKMSSSSNVFAVVYAGLVASGLVSAIQSWGVKKYGPIAVAASQPLETLAVAVLSFVFLKEGFRLGSLIGALVVISGLYILIWGQAKEREINQTEKDLLQDPLLIKEESIP